MNLIEHEVCSLNCKNLIKRLKEIELSFKPNSQTKHSILHYICVKGDINLVKYLWQLGIDFSVTDQEDMNPCFIALQHKNYELAQLLFMNNFKPVGPKRIIMNMFEE